MVMVVVMMAVLVVVLVVMMVVVLVVMMVLVVMVVMVSVMMSFVVAATRRNDGLPTTSTLILQASLRAARLSAILAIAPPRSLPRASRPSWQALANPLPFRCSACHPPIGAGIKGHEPG